MKNKCKDVVDELYRYAEKYREPPTGMEVEGTAELLEKAAKCIGEASYSAAQLTQRYVLGMPVHRQGNDEMDGLECPCCGYEVGRNDDFDEMHPRHCPECGTRLIY